MRVLVTGGAGFVGSHLALLCRTDWNAEVHVLDNLKRRGSELNLAEFKNIGIHFHHGDVRVPEDLESLPGSFDLLLECSAEPSVHAGTQGSVRYVIDTNLGGTINCLEFARQRCNATIFLSTSRVYSVNALRSLPLVEQPTRLDLSPTTKAPGYSFAGINEAFDITSARTFYGTSKLASEFFCQEYETLFQTRIVLNRCGVICGPGQFGKTDQGVFSLWVARHLLGTPLSYTGFGGKGLQVRDLLHPRDLFLLIQLQLDNLERCRGQVFNVGGARKNSASLLEFTRLCQELTGRTVPISSNPETNPVDVPFYVSDTTLAEQKLGWQPTLSLPNIVAEILSWMKRDEKRLKYLYT